MAPKKDAALAARLAHARELGTDLSTKTDLLNSALSRAEKQLRALNLGSDAWIDITSAEDKSNSRTTLLGFGKVASGWRLLIQQNNSFDELSVDPLLSTSRELRVRVAPYIPLLVERLIDETEKQVRSVDAAIESLSGIGDPPEDGTSSKDDTDDSEIPF